METLEESWLDALKRWVDATSARRVAKALGISPATVSLCLRNLYPASSDNIRIRVEALLVGQKVPDEVQKAIVAENMDRVLRTLPDKPSFVNIEVNPESIVQQALTKREKGQIEVPCLAGYVDFLTATEVVEIKNWKGWKEAVKVLIYVDYFPGRTPRVHLFNNQYLTHATRDMIQRHYDRLGIRLTWHDPFIKP